MVPAAVLAGRAQGPGGVGEDAVAKLCVEGWGDRVLGADIVDRLVGGDHAEHDLEAAAFIERARCELRARGAPEAGGTAAGTPAVDGVSSSG